MNRSDLLQRISTFLARFTEEVGQLNQAGLYDINIHAENVLLPLLKIVFNFEALQNANVVKRNAVAVDLIDYDARVSVQVTSTGDSSKISETLVKFKTHNHQRAFDRLIFIILTKRQKYRKDFEGLLPDNFDFQTERDVMDNAGLFTYISQHILSIQKLQQIERILSDEFSELKIAQRDAKVRYRTGFNDADTEQYFPNLVLLELPQLFYQAEVDIDFEKEKIKFITHLKKMKRFGKIKHISHRDIVNFKLQRFLGENERIRDYIVRNNKIYTFRDLNSTKEILRKIIDIGTITSLSDAEYISENEDRKNNFKELINCSLTEDLSRRQIQWIGSEKTYRFAIGKGLNAKKVEYKNKGRKVIYEVWSKSKEIIVEGEDGVKRTEQEQHIVCFRHLSFRSMLIDVAGKWYMSIKPEWMFTSPLNGVKRSRYSDKYLTGIKQFEWNDTIYDQFTFLSEYLAAISKGDMFGNFVIKIKLIDNVFTAEQSIPEALWTQSEVKIKFDKDQIKLFGE